MGFQFPLHQGDDLPNECANIQQALFASLLAKHGARACNYLVNPVPRPYDLLEVRSYLL